MTVEVVYSRHARQRMVLRRISSEEVDAAIRSGSKSRGGPRVVAAQRYFELGYVIRGNKIIGITVKPRW
jgi:hypothetical protein